MNARDNSLSEIDEVAIYVLGRVEQFIEDFAKSSGTSAYELTARVAELLHSQVGQQPVDQVPEVRSGPARNHRAVEPVEVAGGARDDGAQIDRRRRKHQHYSGGDRFTVARDLWKQGLTVKQIARTMKIHPHTAGTYISKAMRDADAEKKKREYRKSTGKGGSYNGKHWMQDPANREKMMKQVQHMNDSKAEIDRQRLQ